MESPLMIPVAARYAPRRVVVLAGSPLATSGHAERFAASVVDRWGRAAVDFEASLARLQPEWTPSTSTRRLCVPDSSTEESALALTDSAAVSRSRGASFSSGVVADHESSERRSSGVRLPFRSERASSPPPSTAVRTASSNSAEMGIDSPPGHRGSVTTGDGLFEATPPWHLSEPSVLSAESRGSSSLPIVTDASIPMGIRPTAEEDDDTGRSFTMPSEPVERSDRRARARCRRAIREWRETSF